MASDEYASTVLSIMETLYGLGTTMGPFIGKPQLIMRLSRSHIDLKFYHSWAEDR
jgi:fucose permease